MLTNTKDKQATKRNSKEKLKNKVELHHMGSVKNLETTTS
jgi:hypothetical protein